MALFFLISLWLIISIIMSKNPTEILSNAFSKIPNPTNTEKNSIIASKDSLIVSLETQLADCQGINNFTKAIVIIDGSTLNMRNEPSLTADVVMRIPASSEVEIMFYDTETYYLNGQSGRWCRIRYASTEGWVWGNFIREI